MIRAHLPALACLSILCGMLFAGLTPFHSPKNVVSWLANQNGLSFGRQGIVLSSGTFQMTTSDTVASCSLEIWVQPGVMEDSSVFLSFATPENHEKFLLKQYTSSLIMTHNEEPDHRAVNVGVENVFHQSKPVFLTFTSDEQGTVVYIDGALVDKFPHFQLGKDLTGQLVVGGSPVAPDGWRGEVLGLAIYNRKLTPAQVREHFETWTKNGRSEPLNSEQPVALYLFDEHAGSVIHNAVHSGVDLNIPERYMLPYQRFLEPFWQEYGPGRTHLKDVLVNIVGFMPLGLCFYAYWTLVRPIKRAAMITMFLGFALSLTIEVLQSFLPTRNSGTTDLITNTFGTFLGLKLYGWKTARAIVEKVYQIPAAGQRPTAENHVAGAEPRSRPPSPLR
jgi:VanZ family protein